MAADWTKYFIMCNAVYLSRKRSLKSAPLGLYPAFLFQILNGRANKKKEKKLDLKLNLFCRPSGGFDEKHQHDPSAFPVHETRSLPQLQQVRQTDSLPHIHAWHVRFQWLCIDSGMFLRFRMEQPVYINIIRDPINRFLSNYFFRRFGDWRGEQNHLIRTPRMKDDERYLVRVSFCSLVSSVLVSVLSPTRVPQGCVRLYGKLVTSDVC